MDTEKMQVINRRQVDDQEDVPLPGFRFHPTDEELVGFYLRRKVDKKPIHIDLIKQIDIYKYDPWDLPQGNDMGDREWYFFCKRGRKYRNSIRPNRVTGSGFWKATGIDRPIYSSAGPVCIGLKKSLVYYRGSAGKGTKTEWMMHEFRLPPSSPTRIDAKSINHMDDKSLSQEAVGGAGSLMKMKCSPKKKLLDSFMDKPIWNPTDSEQLSAVKEALHVSTAPSLIVCREDEQRRIVEFCKQSIEQQKAGSLYICGCPGTGKSLSMEKVKGCLNVWAKETGDQLPDTLTINCTSLSTTSEIFNKILEKSKPNKKVTGRSTPLKQLQQLYSQKQQSHDPKMMLVIADELDYLITKDRVVLHDLFMLTTLPFSEVILIGIANAIDLADRFLPKLQSLNCKPTVVSFRAYSMDQIMIILKQRLMALPYTVFQPQALELCARKVAAASGDMRKALGICRGAIEMLESELRESLSTPSFTSMVRVDHMAIALSKAYKSPIVDTIQSLPQHQQIVLCSAVKRFRRGKKDTTIGELYKFYIDICKSTLIPPVGIMELTCMCRVLGDQGILKLGQSRDDKLRRVTLQIDESDIIFALQGIRFFRNCLQ